MLLDGSKKMTSYIVSRMKEQDKTPDFVDKEGSNKEAQVVKMDKPESDYELGLLSAASDILYAIKQNDEKSLNKALKAHYEMCEAQEYEEEEEENESEK